MAKRTDFVFEEAKRLGVIAVKQRHTKHLILELQYKGHKKMLPISVSPSCHHSAKNTVGQIRRFVKTVDLLAEGVTSSD
jgi:hypothetical protein